MEWTWAFGGHWVSMNTISLVTMLWQKIIFHFFFRLICPQRNILRNPSPLLLRWAALTSFQFHFNLHPILFSSYKTLKRDTISSKSHIVLVHCISIVILPFQLHSLLGLRPVWSLSWVDLRLSWTRRSRAWRGDFPRRSSIKAGVRYWAPLLTLCVEAPLTPPPPNTTPSITLTPPPSMKAWVRLSLLASLALTTYLAFLLDETPGIACLPCTWIDLFC